MKPEGKGWIRAKVAAKMLGVREDYVKNLVYRGELKRWEGNRKPFYYRIEDVEALAREPERVRRMERRESALGLRRSLAELLEREVESGKEWARRLGLISATEAAQLLGISRIRVGELARRGQLSCFQRNEGRMGSPYWFLRSEVLVRRAAREAEVERETMPRERSWRMRRPRYIVRQKLKAKGRLDMWDVTARERYFGEWITARQAACLLNVSMSTVHAHRRKGHLRGQAMPDWGYGGRLMFLKREVLGLRGSEKYCERRYRWEAVHSEAGKERRRAMQAQARAAELTRELEICNELARSAPRVSERLWQVW